jgi:iron complex transport system permease protein
MKSLIETRKRRKRFLTLLILVLSLTVFITPCVGSVFYDPVFVLESILKGLNRNDLNIEERILIDLRIPRVLMGLIVGLSLSISGVIMQTVFRNPMAEPYVLGISSGAGLGATIGFVLALGVYSITSFAFITSLLTVFLVYNLAKVRGYVTTESLLLSGIAVNFFLYALEWLLLIKTNSHMILSWLVGNLGNVEWNDVMMCVPAVFLSCLTWFFSNGMNAMLFGDENAVYLGVDVQNLRKVLILLSTLTTALTVSFIGLVGFVGLMIPHIARVSVGEDSRFLIPASALIGAVFLVWMDALSRVLNVPVGIITMLCGGPFFLYLLRRER